MAKLKKADLIQKAEDLKIDISGAKNNAERKDFINAELIKRSNIREGKLSDQVKDIDVVDEEVVSEEVKEIVDTTDNEPTDRGDDTEIPSTENFGRQDMTKEEFEKQLNEAAERTQDGIIKLVHEVRLDLDKALQFSKVTLGEKSDTFNYIFHGKSWLGKMLGELGTDNPYKTKSPIKNAREIPPTADVWDNPKEYREFTLLNHLDKIIKIRELLGSNTESVLELSVAFRDAGSLASLYSMFSYQQICQARFELGYELSVIRNKSN